MKKMQFFCSIAKNTSGLLGEMAVFSGRGLFCLGPLPSQEKNCFAQRRRDAEEEGGDESFLSNNSASPSLCAIWKADEVVPDLYRQTHHDANIHEQDQRKIIGCF
jgi:hypothetical protein